MTTMHTALPDKARYSFGGDEFLLIEVAEAMSLEANFRILALTSSIRTLNHPGIVELCPANASLLIRFDPDVIAPETLRREVEELEKDIVKDDALVLSTRIVRVPVWFGDPFTTAVAKRFREGYHQDPNATDLEYSAAINGLDSTDAFVKRYCQQPWMVTMVGFVAGLPFLYQLVEQEKQLQVPKYLSPRPGFTPALTLGHGGCFGAQYSVEGAGGYQMLGIMPGPIFDATQQLPDFADSMVFYRPGDIVQYEPIDKTAYDKYRLQVEEGTFSYNTTPVQFDTSAALVDPTYSARLLEVSNDH